MVMTMKKFLLVLPAAVFLLLSGFHVSAKANAKTPSSPATVLNRYFSSAVNQDYGTTYSCYYSLYKKKVSKDEYIRHRREASVLQRYKIISVRQKGDAAQAVAILTFAPSQELHRKKPTTIKVKEELVKEGDQWRIKVW